MSLVLTGDLGGTNIRYKLTEITPQSDTVLKSYVYPTSAYRGNIIGSIKEFLIDLKEFQFFQALLALLLQTFGIFIVFLNFIEDLSLPHFKSSPDFDSLIFGFFKFCFSKYFGVE